MVIDGEKIAEKIIARLRKRPVPGKFLAAVLVGNDAASASFVRQKERVAKELGVDFRMKKLEADVAESAPIKTLKELGANEDCGGIILQLPLPARLNRGRIIAAIPSGKDVDALHGKLVLPPAAGVVEEILTANNYRLTTVSRVAVVGMGFLVGKPIAKWLKGKVRALITLDIGDDLARLKEADVVILGVGKANLIEPTMLKRSALVIDFGYSRKQMADGKARMAGDFDTSLSVDGYKLLAYTPVPGGTGPILVAKLFENFYLLNTK